jgi:hypothetical protein
MSNQTSNCAAVSPLRRRMIEDMTIRQFGEHTKRDYVRQVREFAAFLGRSPDRAEPEDLRRYQLHLASLGASYARMNLAGTALRFFFHVTLGRFLVDICASQQAQLGLHAFDDRKPQLTMRLNPLHVLFEIDWTVLGKPGSCDFPSLLVVSDQCFV